jgi:hypothetical protein
MIDDVYDCRVYFAAGLALKDFLNIPVSLSTFLGGVLICLRLWLCLMYS